MNQDAEFSLEQLASFGDVAAEDDSVLDYFLQTDAVHAIESNRAFLVLGRKGAGKTAIVRHLTEGPDRVRSKSLNLRGYPWKVHSTWINSSASEMESYISSWRYLIALEIATMVAADAERSQHDKVVELRKFLFDNYGGTSPDLNSILQLRKLKLSKLSIAPSLFGFQLGSIEIERSPNDHRFGLELDALSDAIFSNCREIMRNEGLGPYMLHFDELDQGLSRLDDTRSKLLVGLILAARNIRKESEQNGIPVRPFVYLRTDLWDDLEFSDKNKIGKTQTLRLEWTKESLMELIEIRLKAKLSQSATWISVSDAELMRGSQAKWDHIVSRTFLRPRDVIHFLNVALGIAKLRSDSPLKFSNRDIVTSRESYSSYLKEELDDEVLPHWPKWEQALQACSAIRSVTFNKDDFKREYNARKTAVNSVTADEALELMYRFSIIGYSTRSGYGGSSWTFQYIDPQAGWDNGASQFKVHLGLKEYAKLREERKTGYEWS